MNSGEFINLLFWNAYSLTKLAGFTFLAGCCYVAVGVAVENAGEQLSVASAVDLAFTGGRRWQRHLIPARVSTLRPT